MSYKDLPSLLDDVASRFTDVMAKIHATGRSARGGRALAGAAAASVPSSASWVVSMMRGRKLRVMNSGICSPMPMTGWRSPPRSLSLSPRSRRSLRC